MWSREPRSQNTTDPARMSRIHPSARRIRLLAPRGVRPTGVSPPDRVSDETNSAPFNASATARTRCPTYTCGDPRSRHQDRADVATVAPCGGEQRQRRGGGHGDPQTVRPVDVPRGYPTTPETDSPRRHRAFLPDVESRAPGRCGQRRNRRRVRTQTYPPVRSRVVPRNRLLPGDLLLQEGIRSKSPEPRAVFDRAVEAK